MKKGKSIGKIFGIVLICLAIISSLVPTVLSVRPVLAATYLDCVHVWWHENEHFYVHTIPGGEDYTINRNPGSEVWIRIYRTADAPVPITFGTVDVWNNIDKEINSSNLWEDFTESVGPYPTRVYAYVNSLEGCVTINIYDLVPDFYVSNTQVDGTSVPGEYQVGDTVKVACEVWNDGPGDAESSRLGYYIGTSPTDTSDRWEDGYVAALGVSEKSDEYEYYTFQQSDVGTRYFVFKADYQNEVDEGDNEGNNLAHFGPFTVYDACTCHITASPDNEVCADTDVTLTEDGGDAVSWYWTTGETTQSIVVSSSGTYGVTITDENNCESYCEIEVTVYDAPVASASSNSPVLQGETIQLYGGPDGMFSYSWTGPGGWTSTLQNPTRPNATTAMTGVYTLVVTNEHGCSDDATTSISVGDVYSVTLNPDYGFYGEMIEVTAVVAGPDTYHICWDSRVRTNVLGTFTATEAGTYSLTFHVPESETGIHTVYLVEDTWADLARAEFEVKDFNEGDILFGYGTALVPGFWSHTGMYIGNRQVVHSHSRDGEDGRSGVDIVTLEWWNETYEPWAVYRVSTASSETITSAIEWATAPERLDDPYDWRWIWKSNAGQEWYCSELVWAAYWNATGGTLDIEDGPDNVGITPDEIANDDDTQEVFTTRIIGNPPDGLMLQALCPVDLAIVNPDGLSVNKEICEIDGAVYGEDDLEGDVQDWIGIPGTKTGDYSILVIPEPGASPQDTYSLVISAGNESIMLADSAQIGDIPDQGYIVRSTEEGIEQIIPRAGCFIATAAYGTPMAGEVEILREFRDKYLLTNPLGQAFVNLYYRVSPPVAEIITEHPSLKPIVRAALVPALAMSTVVVNSTPAEKIAIIGSLLLVSVAVAVWMTRRRGRDSEYS